MRLTIPLIPFLVSLTATTADPRASSIDCHPRAWVRAPDLVPGMVTAAQARLSLNGTECPALKEWKVGLRMKERAIFKFHAANVTMPQRPVIDDIPVEDDDEEDVMGPFIQGDIFETHSVRQGGRTRRWDAFRAKLREYEESLAARSLWTSRSATREVFDTSFSLPLDVAQTDHTDTRTTWLADFRVNFPYGTHRTMHFSSGEAQQDISTVESMFEYYFTVTYADGTTIDIPAGKTAFLPAAEGTREGTGLEGKVVQMTDERPVRDEGGVPECDRGLVSEFRVTVDLPADITLVAGSTHMLPVTIHQTGNSSQQPTRISARVTSCTTDTWAASYAFDASHQREATTCEDLHPQRSDEAGRQSRRRGPFFMDEADRVLQTKREDEYEVPTSPSRGPRELWFDGDGMGLPLIGKATSLKGVEKGTTVLVNVTIPEDITYTANRTLQTTSNRLYISLQTRYACQTTTPDVGDELKDDELWSAWWRESAKGKKDSGNWVGNVEVVVRPPLEREWTASVPLVDYMDPRAKAIVLSALEAPALRDDDFPAVNVQVTESESDLQRAKYDVWARLPLCKEYKMRGHCVHGLGDGLTGELWARYEWRKERQGQVKETSQVVLQ